MKRLVLSAALLLAGCSSKDAVSLSSSVQNAALAVQAATLGTALSGKFELRLELGARADAATDVTPDKFSVLSVSDESTIVSTLSASTQDATYPVHVDVGQTRTLSYVLDDKNTLDPSVQAALCAGDVRIAGSLTDTLNTGKSTITRSGSFAVTGCP